MFWALIFIALELSYSKPLKLDIKVCCDGINFKVHKSKNFDIVSPLPYYSKNDTGFSIFFNRFPSVSAIVDNVKSLNLGKTYQEPATDIYTEDIKRHANLYEKDVLTKNTYIRPTNKGNELVELYQNDVQLDFGIAFNKKFK